MAARPRGVSGPQSVRGRRCCGARHLAISAATTCQAEVSTTGPGRTPGGAPACGEAVEPAFSEAPVVSRSRRLGAPQAATGPSVMGARSVKPTPNCTARISVVRERAPNRAHERALAVASVAVRALRVRPERPQPRVTGRRNSDIVSRMAGRARNRTSRMPPTRHDERAPPRVRMRMAASHARRAEAVWPKRLMRRRYGGDPPSGQVKRGRRSGGDHYAASRGV